MDVKSVEQSTGGDLAVAITLQATLDGGKQMVLQTYIGRDEEIGAYNKLTDKLYRVVERQEWKTHVVNLKTTIEADERTARAMEADYNRVEVDVAERWKVKGKQGDPRLTPQESAARSNLKTSIEARRENIAKLMALKDELEAKLKDG